MIHAPDLGVGPNHLQAVVVGLPVVDDDGQVQLLRQLQLLVEHLLLVLPGRVVLPVVVQADLPNGLYLGAGGQGPQLLQPAVLPVPAVGGVDPHGGVDEGEALRQLHGGAGGLQVTARIDNQFHAPGRHGSQQFQPVAVERAGVVVGVGIEYVHKRCCSLQVKLIFSIILPTRRNCKAGTRSKEKDPVPESQVRGRSMAWTREGPTRTGSGGPRRIPPG